MTKSWMVRAERNGRLFDAFKEKSVVAIGWPALGDLSQAKTRKTISEGLAKAYAGAKPQSQAMAAGQLHRFVNEMNIGDMVVTYDPSRRVYLVGEIASAYRHDTSIDPEDTQVRSVRWDGEVSRDLLSVESRNSLGSISTLFRLSNDVAAELKKALSGNITAPAELSAPVAEEDLFESMASRAHEFIKDKVNALSWSEMQDLVAGLLRSLGYKTRVSDTGPDQGKDIVASPDGFGFEAPRIVVEVKHRKGSMALRTCAISSPGVMTWIRASMSAPAALPARPAMKLNALVSRPPLWISMIWLRACLSNTISSISKPSSSFP